MIDRRMIPQFGCEISRLGYGGMRFPKNGDEVDVKEAVKLLRKAYDMGVNYFDTAYMYCGGKSESIIKKALVERFSAKHLKSTIVAATIWQTK